MKGRCLDIPRAVYEGQGQKYEVFVCRFRFLGSDEQQSPEETQDRRKTYEQESNLYVG
jgi:hypothetical protein